MGSEAVALLSRLAGTRIVCIGDVMLDRYVYGDASRISPEAPVPVVHVRRQVCIPGGVGNVVRNLAEWKVVPMAVGVVGEDGNADILSGFLSDGGETRLALIRDKSRPTSVKTRIVAGIQQVVRFDEETLAPLSDAVVTSMLNELDAMLPDAGAVAVSDYGKGVVTPRLCRDLIAKASAMRCPVAIDPKGYDYEKYSGADLVKPNRKELGEGVGDVIDSDDKAVAAGRSLIRKYGIKNILVTLSERGMLLLQGETAQPAWLPSRAREVYDVTGAGDTVLAALTAAMAARVPLSLGARLATLAAGVVVGKVGTAVAPAEDIGKAAMEEDSA